MGTSVWHYENLIIPEPAELQKRTYPNLGDRKLTPDESWPELWTDAWGVEAVFATVATTPQRQQAKGIIFVLEF